MEYTGGQFQTPADGGVEEAVGVIVLDDETYNKGKFLLQGQIMKILEPLEMYGQREYVKQATRELVRLAEDWGLYIRGDLSKPISLDYIRRVR